MRRSTTTAAMPIGEPLPPLVPVVPFDEASAASSVSVCLVVPARVVDVVEELDPESVALVDPSVAGSPLVAAPVPL
ncbi:MAG: hypothetical protein ABW211_06975, partial [Acidimicrobiia bacterium]